MSGSSLTVSKPRAFNAWLYFFQFFVLYARVDQLDFLMRRAYYGSRFDLCNKVVQDYGAAFGIHWASRHSGPVQALCVSLSRCCATWARTPLLAC